MLADQKLHGKINVNVCDLKGYQKSFFQQALVGRVLTTGGNTMKSIHFTYWTLRKSFNPSMDN